MAIGLIVIAIGSFIAGAACVGIQLEKVKRQRDEALDEDGCLGGCLLPVLVVMIIIWFGRYMLHWW